MKTKMKVKGIASSLIFSLVGIAAVLVIWIMGVKYTEVGLLLPTPMEVLERALHTMVNPIGRKYTLLMHLAVSLRRVLIGFSLSAGCGILLGISMGRFKMIEAIFKPLFEVVRPIPSVAWIPLAIVWFGIGETAKIFIIFMAGFVNITVNTYAGAKQVDENMMGVAYMLGANEIQAFFRVVIPSCIPYIFAGMHVGLSTCWMAVLAAEMVSSTEGIGWTITAGQENGDMTQIFVGIIAIAIVGLLLAVLMRWAERVLCKWRVRGK